MSVFSEVLALSLFFQQHCEDSSSARRKAPSAAQELHVWLEFLHELSVYKCMQYTEKWAGIEITESQNGWKETLWIIWRNLCDSVAVSSFLSNKTWLLEDSVISFFIMHFGGNNLKTLLHFGWSFELKNLW